MDKLSKRVKPDSTKKGYPAPDQNETKSMNYRMVHRKERVKKNPSPNPCGIGNVWWCGLVVWSGATSAPSDSCRVYQDAGNGVTGFKALSTPEKRCPLNLSGTHKSQRDTQSKVTTYPTSGIGKSGIHGAQPQRIPQRAGTIDCPRNPVGGTLLSRYSTEQVHD